LIDRETAGIALVIVTILAVFAAVQPLIPTNSEKFSELGILGPNQTIANYPTSLKVGQPFSLYGYIGNHEGLVEYYRLLIKLGNQSTQISNSSSADLLPLLTYSRIIDDNQSWVFPIGMSINQTGTNLKLIFELWAYNETLGAFQYTGLWDQLYLNVSSSS
jgi:uncharacterized membrane protein